MRSQNFQSFKQFNTYLDKRYGHFCTSTTKNLNASHNGVLAGEGLSFELLLHSRLIIFHDDDLNYSHVKQTANKTNGNFTVLLGKALG